jgi:hypothetical protein
MSDLPVIELPSDRKRCPGCDRTLPRSAFGVRVNGFSRARCRSCDVRGFTEWRARNRERDRASQRRKDLRLRHGITEADYDRMLARQGGRCAICGDMAPAGRRRFSVDHDHRTGRRRGLLCDRCNLGVGLFLDDPEILAAAAAYLNEQVDAAAS